MSGLAAASLRQAVAVIDSLHPAGFPSWGEFKKSGVRHLLRMPALSRFNLITGGGPNIINALKKFHGPSWRMVVHMTDKTEAYGIYPGGQSGNPGSRFYDNAVDDWAAGKYYKLWIMAAGESRDPRIKHRMTFSK